MLARITPASRKPVTGPIFKALKMMPRSSAQEYTRPMANKLLSPGRMWSVTITDSVHHTRHVITTKRRYLISCQKETSKQAG